jgi:3'-phosphoadenosine 5'-phosphosulfate sulfotransferase (PAPS reductase)/FAD synthetase
MSKTHNIVSVSGGKDSTALLLLAMERGAENLQAVFADTGHEQQQTYDYVRYLEQATSVPIRWVRADFSERIANKATYVREKWLEKGVPAADIDRALAVLDKGPTGNPFLDLCIWKGRFPSTKARFCSEELKRNPIVEQVQMPLLDAGHEVISWQGVRADESPARALLKESECVGTWPDTGGELWNYRPILKWTAEQCFDMHRRHGIKHNPLYEQGMGRVGCMPCIHARKDELLEISKRFPDEVARVAEWERIVSEASKRKSATFFAATDIGVTSNSEDTVRDANIFKFVEWSKTSRGGKQYDLIRADQTDGFACSSIYGLCE